MNLSAALLPWQSAEFLCLLFMIDLYHPCLPLSCIPVFLFHPASNPPPSPIQSHLLRHAPWSNLECTTPTLSGWLFSHVLSFSLLCRNKPTAAAIFKEVIHCLTDANTHIYIFFFVLVAYVMWSPQCVDRQLDIVCVHCWNSVDFLNPESTSLKKSCSPHWIDCQL